MPAPPHIPLSAIRQPAFLYGPDGRIIAANDSAESLAGRPLAGRSLAAVVGILDVRAPDGTPLMPADLPAARALRGEEAVNVPLAVTAADGRNVNVLATASPVRDGAGLVGALSIWQDVSALETARAVAETAGAELQVQAEELRQQGDELLRASAENDRQRRLLDAVVRTVPSRISLWSPEGRCLWANEMTVAHVGETWQKAGLDPNVMAAIIEEAGVVAATGVPSRNELQYPAVDGPRWVENEIVPFRSPDGTVTAALVVSNDITERKRAEEAVRLHAEELETLMETVPIAIFVSRDPECHVVTGNRMANTLYEAENGENITGTPAPGEPPSPRRFFVEGREIPGEELPMQVAAARGVEIKSAEIEVHLPGGTTRFVLGSAAPLRRPDGTVRGCLGAFLDITERKEMERALVAGEQRQAFLLELGDRVRELFDVREISTVASEMVGSHLGANGVVFCEIDPTGQFSSVQADWTDGTVPSSAGTFRMDDFGIGDLYRQGVVRRTEDITVEHGEDETAAHCALRIRASLGVPICHGGRLAAVLAVHSSRPRTWTDAEVELVRQAGDRIWAAVERARADEALRESEERLRLAQENANVTVWDRDLRTGALTHFPGPSHLYGLKEGRVDTYGKWKEHVHPDDLEWVEAEREAALATGEPFDLEYRIVRPSGEIRWVASIGRGYCDTSGEIARVLGVAIDITSRKTAELALARSAEDLRRSNEELQRFAYVASHDLQEPLRSIISFSQLLERRYKGQLGQDADEYINFIVEGGNRMQALIQDLLQVSRVETGAKPPAPTDADAVVLAALRALEAPIRESGATVTVEALPVVMADWSQLEQVFANLIGNAIKYGRPGVPPEIRIEGWRVGPMVQFAVADNGIGIEAEYFDRIFEMFRRLHTHDQYDGTGIGLAVVKKIVERHGGRVWVESTPGEGSTFFFTLPAV